MNEVGETIIDVRPLSETKVTLRMPSLTSISYNAKKLSRQMYK